MKVDLVRSQGSAGIAAAAQTDFDIRRNAASITPMRFGAGVVTASFITASEIVPEPGDVVSLAAPPTPDVALADIGFTIVGALVT